MIAYIQFPSWLNPEVIPGIPIRWYGLMYLVAFVIAFRLLRKQMNDNGIRNSDDEAAQMITWGIVGLLLGARIFATLVYDDTAKFLTHPWLIFWPFDEHNHFTGFQGMSYHGGVIGGVIGLLLYSIKKKQSFFKNADMMVTSVPFGYFFGRIGNFINGELYGRVTTSPIGVLFPYAERFQTKEKWVRNVMDATGLNVVSSGTVNLPRHPSQLYEAFFEGLALGLLMWFVFRKMRLNLGIRTGLYFAGYGAIRFIIEYFREPDKNMGFILSLSEEDNPIYLLNSFLDFSMGQLLCYIMIVAGALIILFCTLTSPKDCRKHRSV